MNAIELFSKPSKWVPLWNELNRKANHNLLALAHVTFVRVFKINIISVTPRDLWQFWKYAASFMSKFFPSFTMTTITVKNPVQISLIKFIDEIRIGCSVEIILHLFTVLSTNTHTMWLHDKAHE